MPSAKRADSDFQEGSWRPSDPQLGYLIENRLDEAYVLSWPGPLETYVPLHDTGGYDRARAPMGTFDFRLEQIKGTATLHSGNQIHIGFNAPAHSRKDMAFTFLYFDLARRELADPAFKVPSPDLESVCTRMQSGHKTMLEFVANRSGLAQDRAAKYQIAIRDLAATCGWSVLPPTGSHPLPAVSSQPVEANTFFKRHFDAAFLELATGDEVLMAAQPDVFGRHRLAFLKSSNRWASISIHGGTSTSATDLIQANIHVATFSPHLHHYVLIQHFDRQRGEWHPWSWFIPSIDFARLARGKGPYLLFTTTLNPQRVNRWTPYRTPTGDVARTFLTALHGSSIWKVA